MTKDPWWHDVLDSDLADKAFGAIIYPSIHFVRLQGGWRRMSKVERAKAVGLSLIVAPLVLPSSLITLGIVIASSRKRGRP